MNQNVNCGMELKKDKDNANKKKFHDKDEN